VFALALAISGCGGKKEEGKAPEKASEGVEASFTGSVSKVYSGDLGRCVAAAKAALQKLAIKVTEESGAIFKKTLDGEGPDGTVVSVKVTEVGKTTTRITVKVGRLFGDEDAGRRIHSEIESELAGRGPGKSWTGFSSFGDMLRATPAPAPEASPK